MRVKIRGAKIARKVILEFTVHRESKPQHNAFLEFAAAEHIAEYGWSDRTVREFPSKKGQET